jgi:hypothetical protein
MNNKLIHISGITIPIIKSNSFFILMYFVLWLCDSRVSVVNYLCYTPSLPSPIDLQWKERGFIYRMFSPYAFPI